MTRKRVNDYVTDKWIANMVDRGYTYDEVATAIKMNYHVEFSPKTIGDHYRKYKMYGGIEKKSLFQKIKDCFINS